VTLPEFSVRQVVLVNILFLVCLVGGFVSYLRTPVEFFPEIGFNTCAVTTVWMGASAEEVERLVTTRIEEELADIDGVKEIRSVSRTSFSEIGVQFDETLSEEEYHAGVNDLRAAIDRVSDLPVDAEEPITTILSTKRVWSDLRVVVADEGGVGDEALHEVTAEVKSRLEALPGIERVTARGFHDREVRVLVNRDAAARYGLTVVEIADRIRRANLNLPAGSFTGPEGEATLRATGDFESLQAILDTIIRQSPSGTHVRLADVARLETGLEKRFSIVRYNGTPALMLGVAKRDDADILAVSDRVQAFLDETQGVLPTGVTLYKTWDMSHWVRSRMSVLWDNLLTGVALVMLILWVSIGFRNAALTIVAIPFSFLTAIIFFPLLDVTINSMSLVGMLLVSGMLVDDAIIVLENIYRRIEAGEGLHEAVIHGANEVRWPVTAAVTTTACAFAPLLLIPGISGKFMEIMPLTVILCLLASLFECLVILPAHYVDLGSRNPPVAGQRTRPAVAGLRRLLLIVPWLAGRMRLRVDAGIGQLRSSYLQALDAVLQYPKSFVALAASMVLLSLGVASHLEVEFFPSEATNMFVTLEAPTDWSLEQTSELMAGVDEGLNGLLGTTLTDHFTTVGYAVTGPDQTRVAPSVAMAMAWVEDTEEYRMEPMMAVHHVQEVLDRFQQQHPAEVVRLEAVPPRNGPPVGRPVAVRILTDDYQLAKSISLELQAFLQLLPGVSNIEDNLREGQREVRLVMDEDRASRHGLTFQDLAVALRGANDGLLASDFRDPARGDELEIRVLLEERYRRDLASLLQTEVRTPGGYLVKLGDVAGVEISRGFVEFWHNDKRRAVTVYANVDNEEATAFGVNTALETRFADVPLRHPEVELEFGGEYEVTRETMQNLFAAFPVALLLIYGVLAALFRSYLQPLVVATAIPLGMIGVIAGTVILDYKLSMAIMYGAIGLTGVVVNDSLVMVDFINRARAQGLPLLEAVRQSGARRLRPILLTTLTTVFALLPMALGLHGGSRSFGPLAASLTFGLMFAMLGTLFIVPLCYTLLIRAQDWMNGRLHSPRGEGGSSAIPEAPATP